MDEQLLLEDLIERTKPAIPPECRHLDNLLASPFRYGPYPNGSRFRRVHQPEGAFYGADTPETAASEAAFYRLLFFIESPRTPWPTDAAELSAFSVTYAAGRLIDLTRAPFDRDEHLWSSMTDYDPCQRFADVVRSARIEAVRYRSVRDPGRGYNLVLLTPSILTCAAPVRRQTWRIFLNENGVRAICEFPHKALDFTRGEFSADPRVKAFDWKRSKLS